MIKQRYFLLIATAILTCIPAQADSLLIVIDSPLLTSAPGGTVQFFGTLTNTTGSDLFLNADSFNLSGFDPSAIDDSPFFTNAPLFLPASGATGDIGLFNITIPGIFTSGSYPGTLEILGGATSDDQTIIGTVDFTIDVQPASGVPEPSSLSMLALAGALAFVFRKRLLSLIVT